MATTPSVRRRRVRHGDLWVGIGVALLAVLCGAWALRMWQGDLTVPLRYSKGDDTKFYLMLIKGIIDHGWVLTNHSLGAPFGQQLYDYPQTVDLLNLLLLKGVAWPFPQIGVVINLFLLLTFALDAGSAYLVLRRLCVSAPAAAVCAVLFAVLPYHFFRSDSHVFLSSYWSLPLTAYLFVSIVGGEPVLTRRRGSRSWLTRRSIGTVVMCIVIGSTGLYYAVFGFVLLLGATLLAAIARRGRAAVALGAVACAVVVAVLTINLAPTLIYDAGHGSNHIVQHTADAGDDLALSPSYLLLPPLHDRIAPLAQITQRYAAATPPHGYCEQCFESIGTVGDIGFVWLVVISIGAIAGAPLMVRRRATLLRCAAGIGVCLAVATTGAISSLTRVFVSGDIRAWNRMSVLIAFFALVAVGVLLDALRARLRDGRAAGLFWVVGVIVLAFGIADQTSPVFVPNYARDASEFRADGSFVAQIARRLPPRAEIFQMPYVPFPEGYQPFLDPGQTTPYSYPLAFEYEEVALYLHSHGLRWSYGSMKGRATDWEAQLAYKPASAAVEGVAAAGFDGLVVDLRGYPGALGVRLAGELRTLLSGAAPVRSSDGELLFYDLRPLARRLRSSHSAAALAALRPAVLTPLRLACATGRLTVTNPTSSTQTALLSATAAASAPTRVMLRARGPAGAIARELLAAPSGTRFAQRLTLAPGRTVVSVSSLEPAQLRAPAITGSAFAPFDVGAIGAVPLGIQGPPCLQVDAGGDLPRGGP
ncbi:MAG: hypothetical protein ACRDMX_06435 [Solirubrobacteraceae bacterium]